MQTQEKILVSTHEGLSKNKQLNLHITVGLLSFMFMVFHFTTVYFFTLQLESLVLVGMFLGLWNLFAFLFDIPIWIFQYYFSSRQLYIFWVVSQMIAMLIFAIFIFSITNYIADPIVNSVWVLGWAISFFIYDVWNIFLLIIAAACYWFTKEINDITTISYVLNNANPDQYKTIIAKNNISFGAWSFLWLFVAGIILTFHPKFIVFHILFIIAMVFFVMYQFFDNSKKIFNIKDISNFYVWLSGISLKKTAKHMSQSVHKTDIKKTLENTKYLILLPKTIAWKSPWWEELIRKTKTSFQDIMYTLRYSMSSHLIVYWSCIMLLTFGFWDTFAATFLINFLDSVKPGWSFVLLWLIAIPAFGLQSFFWNLSDKIGWYKLSTIGLFLSGWSLITLSFFASGLNIYIVLFCALVNSIGYSICMSISVASFLESYNIAYADRKWLTQIDANASAAPMKILQNLANVIGLTLGGIILWLVGFVGFFFIFGVSIIWFLIWSIFMKEQINS